MGLLRLGPTKRFQGVRLLSPHTRCAVPEHSIFEDLQPQGVFGGTPARFKETGPELKCTHVRTVPNRPAARHSALTGVSGA